MLNTSCSCESHDANVHTECLDIQMAPHAGAFPERVMHCNIMQVDLSQVWITLTSVVVASSFIFKEAASNLYQSVIFLFVVHPLDVGDALLIENIYYKVPSWDYSLTGIRSRLWPDESSALIRELLERVIKNIYYKVPSWDCFFSLTGIRSRPWPDESSALIRELLERVIKTACCALEALPLFCLPRACRDEVHICSQHFSALLSGSE